MHEYFIAYLKKEIDLGDLYALVTFEPYCECMKDPENCPFCESEEKGYSKPWGVGPQGWDDLEERHKREHEEKDSRNT